MTDDTDATNDLARPATDDLAGWGKGREGPDTPPGEPSTDVDGLIRADGSDDRPSVYIENGVAVYRASAVGGPSHVLAAARAGIRPASHTDRTKRYMAEGNLHEPAIMAYVGTQGWLLEHIGADQAELDIPITSRIMVRCHPDGYGTSMVEHPNAPRGTRVIIEAKAMSDAVFSNYNRGGFDEFYRYAVQFSLEMIGSGLPGLFVVKNRNNGEIRWQVFTEPPISLADIRKRLLLIDKGAREGDLNPLNEKCTMFPCQYHFLHDEPTVDIVVDDIIDGLAQMVDEARERRKQAEEVERRAREKLMLALADKQKVATPHWKIAVVTSERKRVDTKRMAADGIDLEPYTSTYESTQLRVTSSAPTEEEQA